jgi:hypothetical protein
LEEEMNTIEFVVTKAFVLFAFSGCEGKSSPSVEESMKAPTVSLQEAVLLGNIQAVRQHIEAGSNLDAKDSYGSSPSVVAATFGVTDAAFALIEGGADVNQTNNDGSTPLHIAAFFCHAEIVQALLNAGADTETRNGTGKTALQIVEGPFENAEPIYKMMQADHGPRGPKLDFERIEATRPQITEILHQHQ